MAEKTLEQTITDLQVQIKSKKLELDNIGQKVNKLLDEKLALVNSILATRLKLGELAGEKQALEKENQGLRTSIKIQGNELKKEKAILAAGNNKLETDRAEFETEKKKAQDSFKSQKESLAKDKQITKEAEQKAKSEANTSLAMQSLLKTELAKAYVLQKEYEAKIKEIKPKQDELTANLDKSKEIKAVLDGKIIEADNLKKKYEILIATNETKSASLDKQAEELKDKAEELEIKDKSLIQRETNLANRQIEADARDKQLDHKELRILKLAKDKGVEAEIKQWQEELGITK